MNPLFVLFIAFILLNCASPEKEGKNGSKEKNIDTSSQDLTPPEKPIATDTVPVYSNKRFREVTIEQTGPNQFLVKGQGQIFEASFGWVIEDGHEEIKNGYATTDAGAPEWGNFSFSVTAEKKRPASQLHLVLFEISAKDGSRQYELPVLLY
ncbi:MAG TPA: Gmad2 immunoglobulin-like domain-containing protein [Chitinophagaceae bacterium]|nr:Gmad2 immunoglobulin-like domain-containing protein [Chitinophagaceae bacterium]